MLTHPEFDPIALQIGPVAVRWYGLMYVAGFMTLMFLAGRRAKNEPWRGWKPQEPSDAMFALILGVMLGGRVGYVLFYHFDLFLKDPAYLFRMWEGGMSFHGGFIGVMLAMWIYARKTQRSFWSVADFFAPLVPQGLAFGRLGNFINGELWGRETDVPWGMVFPQARDGIVRHPSQLYQFAGEGVLLFVVLYWFSAKPRPRMATSALFLAGYGVMRIVAEFFRQPDAHLNFIFGGFVTMGMLLSLPMVLLGAGLFWWAHKNPVFDGPQDESAA